MTSKEIIRQIIVKLEDDLQHYTMVDIDRVKAKYIELEIEDYKQVLQDLDRLEALELNLDSEKYHLVNENKCLKNKVEDLEICFKTQIKENEKLTKAIEIIKNKCVSNSNLWLVVCSRNYEDYKSFVENKDHELVRIEHNILTQEEFELLKEVLGNEMV